MTYSQDFLKSIKSQLSSQRNLANALGAQSYMKNIAPFLGVKTPKRREIVKKIARSLETPSSDQLAMTARALWKLEEREYQYCGYDLIQIYVDIADRNFLSDHVEYLITHKSWWDTVDGLGTAAVSPLTDKYGCRKLMDSWNKSSNIWLIRAAIQHQRGRKLETDTGLILKYCHDHVSSEEFFIQKAIGWALRDISRFFPQEVRKFLKEHPNLSKVALREAERGLNR